MGFGPTPEQLAAKAEAKEEAKRAKKVAKKAKRARLKTNDPKLCAFSRELRDRWQECVEDQPGLIEGAAAARYEVGRLPLGSSSGNAPGRRAASIELPASLEIVSEVIDESKPPAPEGRRLDAA